MKAANINIKLTQAQKVGSMADAEKVKHSCDIGACCSQGEARRIVMQGAFERWVNKAQQKTKDSQPVDAQRANGDA